MQTLQTFKAQNFEGRSFVLDEVVFIECHLKDCDLFYAGGDTEWVNTKFESCRFHWRGPAKNMVALMHVFGLVKQTQGTPTIPQSAGVKPN